MVALPTTPTHSPPRLKTRVGGSTSPRALRVGKIPRQPRGPHRKITTRARRFAVGSSHWSSPEPLSKSPAWVASEAAAGLHVSAYAYAGNNSVNNIDPDGNSFFIGPPPSWPNLPPDAPPSQTIWCMLGANCDYEPPRPPPGTCGVPDAQWTLKKRPPRKRPQQRIPRHCRAAAEECRLECSGNLTGQGFPFWNCVNACLVRQGCPPGMY